MNKPKWLGEPDAPIGDVLGLIASGGVSPGNNVTVMQGDSVARTPDDEITCALEVITQYSHERQVRIRKLISELLVLKRLKVFSLPVEKLEEIIQRLPDRV